MWNKEIGPDFYIKILKRYQKKYFSIIILYNVYNTYRLDLENQKGCGVVAHERLTEPRASMKWLLGKPRSFSNLPAFLDLNGRFENLYQSIINFGIFSFIDCVLYLSSWWKIEKKLCFLLIHFSNYQIKFRILLNLCTTPLSVYNWLFILTGSRRTPTHLFDVQSFDAPRSRFDWQFEQFEFCPDFFDDKQEVTR